MNTPPLANPQPSALALSEHSDAFAGTVVWIGPTKHPEVKSAFEFCEARARQLAVRRDLTEWLQRPADYVSTIIFARTRRSAILPAVAPEISARYASAQVFVLNGSLCDGERRTGVPWKMFTHCRFDRWQDVLGYRRSTCLGIDADQPFTLLLFDRYSDAEPLLELIRVRQNPALWSRSAQCSAIAGVRKVVWDESIASGSPDWDWTQALTPWLAQDIREHHWLVTQPQAAQIAYAMQAGIVAVHSKPLAANSLFAAA